MVATEIKTKIPEGWQRTFLSDGANFRVVGSGVNYWTGLKSYLSTKSVQGTVIAEIEDSVSFINRPSRANMQPEAGVTAFAKMGDTFKVLFSDENIAKNYILSTGFCLVKPKIDPRYFFHFIASDRFQDNKELYCEGSTQKAVSQKDYDKLEILFPKNPKEQQKIAEVLTIVDETIEKTDGIIEKNKRIRQGLMQDLFRYGIDEYGNVRSEKTHKLKTIKIGNEEVRIPEEWECDFLDRISTRGSGHTPSKSHPEYYNGGIKWVSLADTNKLDKFFISETDKEISEAGIRNSSAVLHPAGTVIISRDAGIGKSAILKEAMAVSQHFITWKCGQRLNNIYLYYWLQNDKRSFESVASGSTIVTIGLSFFKKYKIFYPKSIFEQEKIVDILMESERFINKEIAYCQKLRSIKRGLMEDLLTGKVRVNSLITK